MIPVIVGIEKREVVAARGHDAGVARSARAAVRFAAEISHALAESAQHVLELVGVREASLTTMISMGP